MIELTKKNLQEAAFRMVVKLPGAPIGYMQSKMIACKGEYRTRDRIWAVAIIVCVLACIETALATDYYVDAVTAPNRSRG